MEKINDRLLVKDKETGRLGVICQTAQIPIFEMMEESGGIPVIFDGGDLLEMMDRDNLDFWDSENPIPSEEGCGLNAGKKCCIYAYPSVNGLSCERFGIMRLTLMGKKMEAERKPNVLYPKCLLKPYFFKINLLSEDPFSFNIVSTPLAKDVVGDGDFIQVLAEDEATAISEVKKDFERKTFYDLDEVLDHNYELVYNPVG
jgi:hypothetical protein